MADVAYNPTLENIRLTPEQDALMVQMISHINDAPTTIKALTRWQFWFRQIWDGGAASKAPEIKQLKEAMTKIIKFYKQHYQGCSFMSGVECDCPYGLAKKALGEEP
jgi:predicted adenine nucleotide alpha hydrolase (AANH) superfamily ATPase